MMNPQAEDRSGPLADLLEHAGELLYKFQAYVDGTPYTVSYMAWCPMQSNGLVTLFQ